MNRMLATGIDILEYASDKDEGFRILDVVNDLQIPKTSAFTLIHTLLEKNMLKYHNEANKTFTLGSKAYSIGVKYMGYNSMQELVSRDLEKLGLELKTTVFIGTLEGNEVLYQYKYSPPNALLDPCKIGNKAGIYYTALGKCLLAHKPDYDLNSINFVKITEHTVSDADSLRIQLRDVLAKGYSVDNQEIRESIVCIAAPIYNKFNKVEYAVSAASLAGKNLDIEATAKILIECANNISKKLSSI